MKRIIIKSLSLRHFKGIKEFDAEFPGLQTEISGENGSGKTTLMDAFLWLLFGKDSTDRKDFEIKPLDKNNLPLQQVDNVVEGIIIEDGIEISLKRVNREKWVKKRGSTESEYAGNETHFFYNEVPVSMKDYQTKISAICEESLFKLLSNPAHFNSLPWQDRRGILSQMAGDVSREEILSRLSGSKKHIDKLIEALNQRKTLEEYRAQIRAEKKRIKDELEGIPSRIDEINLGLPEEEEEKMIRAEIDDHLVRIKTIEDQIESASKAMEAVNAKIQVLWAERRKAEDRKEEIHRLVRKALDEEFDKAGELGDKLEYRIHEIERAIQNDTREVDFLESGLKSDQNTMNLLRTQWIQENGNKLEFSDDEFRCPTCQREFEAEDVVAKKTEMTANFENTRRKKLGEIDTQGQMLKKRVEETQAKIKVIREKIATQETTKAEAREQLRNLPVVGRKDLIAELAKNKEYCELVEKIEQISEEVKKISSTPVDPELKQEKIALTSVVYELKKRLNSQESRNKGLDRITVLKRQEKDLSVQLAEQEGYENVISDYTRVQSDMIEERVNGMFSLVRFKMFEQQINGGETPTCKTLVNGVPYPDANTASQINAGLDIINALSNHYGVSAPVWIDHAESVNELLPCDSQMIRLVVSKEPSLTIKINEYEMVTTN